jgi:hypothetical protein
MTRRSWLARPTKTATAFLVHVTKDSSFTLPAVVSLGEFAGKGPNGTGTSREKPPLAFAVSSPINVSGRM